MRYVYPIRREKGNARNAVNKRGRELMRIEWEWTICLIFMTICVITDIRKKEIPVIVVALSGGCALLYTIILGENERSEILYSLLPGACLLFLGLCTKESIGYGDGLAAMAVGMWIGWKGCIIAMISGFLLSSICALALLICKKVRGKSRIPFLPFLAVGLGVFYVVGKGI